MFQRIFSLFMEGMKMLCHGIVALIHVRVVVVLGVGVLLKILSPLKINDIFLLILIKKQTYV